MKIYLMAFAAATCFISSISIGIVMLIGMMGGVFYKFPWGFIPIYLSGILVGTFFVRLIIFLNAKQRFWRLN